MCSLPPPTIPCTEVRFARNGSRAFTLLEIMLVVAIIALLLAAGFNYLGDVMGSAKDTVVQSDIHTLDQKLKLYEANNGFYPSTEQGLQALNTLPQGDPHPTRWYQYMEKIPKDPWQQDYVYLQPGTHNPQSYDLYSKGKDRIANTADDVGNWDTAKQ